jgi:hypothetical protein
LRPGDLPPHHRQLMPQDRDLDVLHVRRGTETDQAKNPTHKHESQRSNHHDR